MKNAILHNPNAEKRIEIDIVKKGIFFFAKNKTLYPVRVLDAGNMLLPCLKK